MSTDPDVMRAAEAAEETTLRDYLEVLRRRWWVVALVTVVAAATAFVVSWLRAPVYEARADLIYEQQLDVSNPLTGQRYTDSTTRQVEMRSVDAVLKSPAMERRVRDALAAEGVRVRRDEYEVMAEVVVPEGSGTSSEDSNVVAVKARAGEAELAARLAQAYADSFVAWRRENTRAQIDRAIAAVRAEMQGYQGAAQQSADYLILQQRLRDLQILKATATGNFRVLVPAEVPKEPVEPRPFRSGALGLGVGLFAGIGLAFLLEQFDTRLRRPEEAAAILRQPVLARVPKLSRDNAREGVLMARDHPADAFSEAFRLVRTNLSFMDVDGKVRSLMVTSSLQGEGKSVAVANLAVTLALAGKKVVVVDADLRRPRQHRLFGLGNEVGVSNVTVGERALSEALQRVTLGDHAEPLYVMTSGPIPPNPGEIVAAERFRTMLAELRARADIVLVDSPAMLAVGDTAALADAVDGVVFLVDMEQARRPVLQAAADQLYRLPCRLMGLIVRLPAGAHRDRYYYYSHYKYYSQDGGRHEGRGGRGNGSGRATRTPSAEGAAGGVASAGRSTGMT